MAGMGEPACQETIMSTTLKIIRNASIAWGLLLASMVGCVNSKPNASSPPTAPAPTPAQSAQISDTVPEPDFRISLQNDVNGEILMVSIPNLKYERLNDSAPRQVLVGAIFSYKKGDGSLGHTEGYYLEPVAATDTSGTIQAFPWNQMLQMQFGVLGGLRGSGTLKIAVFKAIPKNDPKQKFEVGKQLSNAIQMSVRL